MQPSLTSTQKRIDSIDILRGIVMVIMALDHVRDYFHYAANTDDPLNLATTTPFLFFTRWITHFCAPVFVFLSGTSIYLQSLRKSKKELSSFLIKRGLWLIFVEWAIISLGWTFNLAYQFIPFQVIWAIGISMVLLGILVRLPFAAILTIGLLIVFGHNLLDQVEAAPGFTKNFWTDLVHSARFDSYTFAPDHYAIIAYPFLPWTGLMMLGYCTGVFFTNHYTSAQRKKNLNLIGIGLIILFVLLRFTNFYGDPVHWTTQKSQLLSFFSFISVNKYPPSLLYMCITIGPALLLLGLLEKSNNRFTGMMRTYGRVAFFYYILHLYLIHIVSAICYFMAGHTVEEGVSLGAGRPFYFQASNDGYNLTIVYIVWISVILALYPLCKWYDQYKSNNKDKWWLSYL